MATVDTNTDAATRSGSREAKDAMDNLLISCGFKDLNMVQTVSDTLLLCSFYSEDGKLQVINKLQRISEIFLVKRICEGLIKLSKMYPNSMQFEEESVQLVDLCCSQSDALLQNGGSRQVATPLDIIGWTEELCDELMTPPKEPRMHYTTNQSSIPLISKHLFKIKEIYETLRNARLAIGRQIQDGGREVLDPFNNLFEALKPRIRFDKFEDLLDQAILIINTDEILDPNMLSKLNTRKDAILLKHWIQLLNWKFLSNWFVVAIAKHDFLVNDETFVRKLPFSDNRTYGESLICVVSGQLNQSIINNPDFELPCDEARLQVFFDHSEVLLRYPSLCFELLQSEVSTPLIQEVLELLRIKRDDTLLPVISKTESEKLELMIKTFQRSLLSANPAKKLVYSSPVTSASKDRYIQTMICSVLFKTLIHLTDEREHLVDVLRLWKDHLSNDTSRTRLLAIVSLVQHLKQLGTPKCMENLKIFLSQLSAEHLDALPSWSSIVEGLITALPTNWVTQGCSLINYILDNFRVNTNPRDAVVTLKVKAIENFVKSLAHAQVSEQDKMKAIEIGLDLFEYAAQPQHYELVLNAITFVVSDMNSCKIRKYVSDLLKAVRDAEIHCCDVWNVVRLIQTSSSIKNKEEILHCFLKVLQDAKSKEDMRAKLLACAEFLRFPVDSANAKRFLDEAVLDNTIYTSILYYLWINEISLDDNTFNAHTKFLLNLVLVSRSEHRVLLYKTVKNSLQCLYYPSVEIFEVIMACMAGSLAAVGTLNTDVNAEALKLLHKAIRTHRLSTPNQVLSLYVVLIKSLRKVAFLGNNGSCTKSFAEGIDLIITLPLPFLELKLTIHRMADIIEEGAFSKEEEVTNIMFHLFHLPSGYLSFTDPCVLASHFERLTSKSDGRLIMASKLSRLNLHTKKNESCKTGLKWLMEVLIKKIPTALEDGISVDLFEFMVEEFSKKPLSILQVALPLIDAAIKETISVEEFKAKMKEISENIPYISPKVLPLLAECIPEFFAQGINEKLDIYVFIELLLSLHWNMFDTTRMYGNLIPLDIPKQLVSVIKDHAPITEILEKLNKIIDVASNANPSIMLLMTQRGKHSDNHFEDLVGHDFNMLVNHTSLRSKDVCLALLLYNNCQITEVLSVSLQKEKLPVTDDNEWPIKYEQTRLLTPGKLAYLIIHQLRRLGIDDVKTELQKLCCKLVENYNYGCPRTCAGHKIPIKFEEYFELFIQIMDESSSLPEVQYWLDVFGAERALLCKNVVMAACSWKAGRRTCDEAIQMNKKVIAILDLLLNRPVASAANVPSNNDLTKQLEIMTDVISKNEDEEIVCRLLNLLCLSVPSTNACLGVIPSMSWSKSESLLLIEQIESIYHGDEETTSEEIDKDLTIILQILPFAAKAFRNSASKLMEFLKMINEKNGGLADDMSLRRLPAWYKQMTDAGYDPQVIQSWCTSLVFSKSLSSSEVDAITNLTPETIKFISKETDDIGRCLFSKDAPRTWETKEEAVVDREKAGHYKRCLLLARLVNEYLFIAHQLKNNEDVVQKIKDGTQELCRIFEDQASPSGEMYKSRDNLLKKLFVQLFSETENKESMEQLINLESLSKSLIILLRRLARSVIKRPKTFGHVKIVLNKINKCCGENLSPGQQYQLVQSNLHKELLRLDQNQACIYSLAASGYNNGTAGDETDLWSASSIQMSAYVPSIESLETNRLARLMRQLWREWRTILSENNMNEVEVNGKRIQIAEMFKYSDSLDEMEAQLEAVKTSAFLLSQEEWSSYRSKELIRREKAMRAKMQRGAEEV